MPLGDAKVAFVTYLNAMHNEIHGHFSDEYLPSIEGLPPCHPLNQPGQPATDALGLFGSLPPPDVAPGLWSDVEIIVRSGDGALVQLGIVQPSGVDAFDAAVLESIERAAPFAPPPEEVLSADGAVHLEWRFYRAPVIACSIAGARPKLYR